MHQTFYIDIDEEITSIVDRLRKAKLSEIIIVVPKRALLIQSIVNLKLLKKEADNLKKEIIIVTQDKLGKLLVEKTGIAVEQRLDDVSGEEIETPEESIPAEREIQAPAAEDEKIRVRLENLGSSEYFEEKAEPAKILNVELPKNSKNKKPEEMPEPEKITNQELVAGIEEDIKPKKSFFGKPSSSSMDIVKNVKISQSGAGESDAKEEEKKDMRVDKVQDFFQKRDMPKRIKQERLKQDDSDYKNVNLSGRFWKFFLAFGAIALVVVALAAAWLFLPKVDIKLTAKTKAQSADLQINGDATVTAPDLTNLSIPAKVISEDISVTKSYDSSGGKSAATQKTHGTITIYNEYSSSPQPLVATTRFQSADGKIFRLVKSVVVPGTTNVGGEVKPGTVDADVIADEAGDAYNIDPATFTIPGFQASGSGKYSKFYAKSLQAMTGGKTGSQTIKTVAAGDINNAKNALASELEQAFKQKIKNEDGQDAVVLDDAINAGTATYSFSNASGEAVDNFSGIAKAKMSAIVFSQNDALEIAASQINKNKDAGAADIGTNAVSLEYGKADTDFAKGSIMIRAHATGKMAGEIDLSNLKKGILGKSEDDFKAYLKSYPQIVSAEIKYWPPFIEGKIPAYESRVNITLDNN